jgi:hypothetical protein
MTKPSTDLWGDITAVLQRLQLELNDLAWRHPAARPQARSRTPSRAVVRSARRSSVMSAAGSRSERETGRARRRGRNRATVVLRRGFSTTVTPARWTPHTLPSRSVSRRATSCRGSLRSVIRAAGIWRSLSGPILSNGCVPYRGGAATPKQICPATEGGGKWDG